MKKIVLITLIFYSFQVFCQKDNEVFELKMSSVYQSEFSIKLIKNDKKIIIKKEQWLDVFVNGNINDEIKKVYKYVKPEYYIERKLTEKEYNKYFNLFKTLETEYIKMKSVNMISSNHGSGVYFYHQKEGKKIFTSSKESAEISNNIGELLKQIETNEVSELIVNKIENIRIQFSKEYFYFNQKYFVKKVSSKPLFIKIIGTNANCGKIIQELPIENEIYIDLTNYSGKYKKCFFTKFKEKFNVVKIVSQMEKSVNPKNDETNELFETINEYYEKK